MVAAYLRQPASPAWLQVSGLRQVPVTTEAEALALFFEVRRETSSAGARGSMHDDYALSGNSILPGNSMHTWL